MRKLPLMLVGLLVGAAPLMMAPSGGGFPSSPQFQAVGVGQAAPAGTGQIGVTNTTSSARIFATNASTNVGVCLASSAAACVAGDTANDANVRLGSGVARFSSGNGGSIFGTIASAGNWTLNAPSAGVTLTINGVSAGVPLSISDGTVLTNLTFSGAQMFWGNQSAHSLNLMTSNTSREAISSAGNVTINAPTSGAALGVTGVSGGTSQSWTDGTRGAALTHSAGLIQIGAVTGDGFGIFTNNTNRLTVGAAGGMILGSPTGGNLGADTLNTAGNISINNVSVCRSDGTNCTGNFALGGTSTVGGTSICRSDGTNCPAPATIVTKTATTSRNTTTALVADPILQITPASGTYDISYCLTFNGTTTGTQGFKFAFNRTSAGSDFFMWDGHGSVSAASVQTSVATAGSPAGTASQISYATISVAGNRDIVCGSGLLLASGGVTYAVEWAQASSSANNTNLLTGWIKYRLAF